MPGGVIYLRKADIENLKETLKVAEKYSARLADTVTASVAAEGRRKGTPIEERQFNMGERQTRWKGGRMESGRFTRKDSSLGGYVSSSGQRMIWFSYETTAARKGGKLRVNALSSVALRSRMANLFESPASYGSSGSPAFRRGDSGPYGRWPRGFSRSGRNYYSTEFEKAVSQAVPAGLRNAEARWEKRFESL